MNSTGAVRACWIGASRTQGSRNERRCRTSTGVTTKLPKGALLELATLAFIDARANVLLIGRPGTGKSHAAKTLARSAVRRGYIVREAHTLIEEIPLARELGEIKKHRAQLQAAEVLVIDFLFLRRLPQSAGEELADVLMSRYEKLSTVVTSNRPVEDRATLLGNVVVVTPLLDRLMHHGHLLKFEGKSWRLKKNPPRALPDVTPTRNHSVPRRMGGGV